MPTTPSWCPTCPKRNQVGVTPPPNTIPPQIVYPPWLDRRFAKYYTPFSSHTSKRNTNRLGIQSQHHCTVAHLKKAVIVVCLFTLEALLEAWATAAEGGAPAPSAPLTPRGGRLLGPGTRLPPPLPALRANLVAKGKKRKGSLCPPPLTTPNLPTWTPPQPTLPEPPPSNAPPPPPPPPPGGLRPTSGGGESRTEARRRPPRVRHTFAKASSGSNL